MSGVRAYIDGRQQRGVYSTHYDAADAHRQDVRAGRHVETRSPSNVSDSARTWTWCANAGGPVSSQADLPHY